MGVFIHCKYARRTLKVAYIIGQNVQVYNIFLKPQGNRTEKFHCFLASGWPSIKVPTPYRAKLSAQKAPREAFIAISVSESSAVSNVYT